MLRNHSFCRGRCLPSTWLGRIVKLIGIRILNPENQWWAANVICEVRYFAWLSFVLDFDNNWSMKYQWRPVSGSLTVRTRHKPAQFKQTCLGSLMVNQGFVHLGAGKTSSRTPLISIHHFFCSWWIWRLSLIHLLCTVPMFHRRWRGTIITFIGSAISTPRISHHPPLIKNIYGYSHLTTNILPFCFGEKQPIHTVDGRNPAITSLYT